MAKQKIDVTGHILIPKQSKLNDKEKEALFKKYNITHNQLPRIHITDPSIAKLDPKEGDVIKVLRVSPTSGTTVFYRGVVNG